MRVLVYPHNMGIGGSQLNAIELAAATRDRGHEVTLVSRTGPLVSLVERLGVRHVELPPDLGTFSIRNLRLLTELARRNAVDVVHGYEWPPAMALYFGPHILSGIPCVTTIMSMAVAPFLPKSIPLVVGTEQIRQQAMARGHRSVDLLEPPVDTRANSPEFDAASFRPQFGLDPNSLLLVVVGRLATELKLEGLLSACDAVGELAAEGKSVQLAIVGDGPAFAKVKERAERANGRARRRVVVLTGALDDPRPAYNGADILLGMGGSALRSLAFAKPLVVQGERGFWRLCSAETIDEFLLNGWFGLGDLPYPAGEAELAAGCRNLKVELAPLLTNAPLRAELGAFGREQVVKRFSLERAAVTQEQIYSEAIDRHRSVRTFEILGSAAGVLSHKLHYKAKALSGIGSVEDFNNVAARK